MRQPPAWGIIKPMNCEPQKHARRNRWGIPRLSLGRFFVVLTVVTLIASHAHTNWQLHCEERRLVKLHEHFGIARVIDPNEPAARRLGIEFTKWRFHVMQPTTKRYKLCGSFSGVDQWKRDFPAAEFELELPEAEEVWIYASYYEKTPATELSIELRSLKGRTTKFFSVPEHHFLDRLSHGARIDTTLWADSNTSWAPVRPWNNQRAPLLLLAFADRDSMWDGKTPTGKDGLILWIEQTAAQEGKE
jgi:hypothetical protein